MNNSEKTGRPQKDLLFILSLIAIIVVALFTVYNKINESELYTYLQKTGQDLLSRVDETERGELERYYSDLMKKVESKEISPAQAEYMAASLINLRQAENILSRDELTHALRTTFIAIGKSDSVVQKHINLEKEWIALQDRLKRLSKFEEELARYRMENMDNGETGGIAFVVDDSLNIIVDMPEVEETPREVTSKSETIVLKNRENMKWRRELKERYSMERNAAQTRAETIRRSVREAAKAFSVSVTSPESDSVKINVTVPEPPRVPTERDVLRALPTDTTRSIKRNTPH